MSKDTDFYTGDYMKNARVSKWYDRVTSSLDKCPFCDLKDKYIILEKNGMVLTVNLFPYIDGHMMVIPKRHIEELHEITPEEWDTVRELSIIGTRLIVEELQEPNTNVLYREGRDSGKSLGHLHVHILPASKKFMQYHKTHFIWEYQSLEFTPLEMAARLRNAMQRMELSGYDKK